MRIIALFLSFMTVSFLSITMYAGIKAGHGQEFYMSHMYWGFATLACLLITLTLCLMFIFKMHSIMHDLIRQLDAKSPETGGGR